MLAMLTWRELNWSSNYCCEKGNYLKGRYIQDNKKKNHYFQVYHTRLAPTEYELH